MNTLEQIKHDYEQTHYRKQRELIDAGKLNYWSLSEKNREGILGQCKYEARKHSRLQWRLFDKNNCVISVAGMGQRWNFEGPYYYRRLDPLPEEQDKVTELKKELKEKEEEIKLIEGNLENKCCELEQLLDETNKEWKDAHYKIEELKKQILSKDQEIKRLQDFAECDNQELERKDTLLENYRKEEAALYRDIRTLAMHITNQ